MYSCARPLGCVRNQRTCKCYVPRRRLSQSASSSSQDSDPQPASAIQAYVMQGGLSNADSPLLCQGIVSRC